jgi:hypothetical protein
VTDEMHTEFFRFISHTKDTPTIKFLYEEEIGVGCF